MLSRDSEDHANKYFPIIINDLGYISEFMSRIDSNKIRVNSTPLCYINSHELLT